MQSATRNQGLLTYCSRNVPAGNPSQWLRLGHRRHFVDRCGTETPNNISFITSFGASPRACSSCYICEPQSTAEAQYPANTASPLYLDFFSISSLALDSLSHVCNHQEHIDPCETQICRISALGRTRWVSTNLLTVGNFDTLGSSY